MVLPPKSNLLPLYPQNSRNLRKCRAMCLTPVVSSAVHWRGEQLLSHPNSSPITARRLRTIRISATVDNNPVDIRAPCARMTPSHSIRCRSPDHHSRQQSIGLLYVP
jgi:hypothetical protein